MNIHPFEQRGLGLAPFTFVELSENVYCACPGAPGVAGGTCDYCGTCIRYECHIRSSDGRAFVVGTDCVRKISREDNRLSTSVDRALAEKRSAERAAERERKYQEKKVKKEAELEAQRDRNGGYTDTEVKQREAEEAARQQRQVYTAENQWLISVLSAIGYESGFVASMLAQISRGPIRQLSEKCQSIMADIYAKYPNNRRNSAKYNTRYDDFFARTDPQN